MSKDNHTRIVVKVGSNVLTRTDGTLDVTRMSALVDQVAELRRDGTEVILVSSGAVAAGRSEVHPSGSSTAWQADNCSPPWDKPNSSTATTSCSESMASPWDKCSQ